MSKNELVAKIEALNEWEALMEEAKAEAEAIRDSIKAEMLEREVEELTAGQYIIRWTSVLSNRFDTTGLRKPTVISTKPLPSRAPAAASLFPADRETRRPQKWGRRGKFL